MVEQCLNKHLPYFGTQEVNKDSAELRFNCYRSFCLSLSAWPESALKGYGNLLFMFISQLVQHNIRHVS